MTTAEANLLAATAHMDGGRLDQAEMLYRKALELDPNCAEAYFKLGNIALKRQLPAEAEACYRRAIDLVPNYVKTLYNLGNLLLRQSRFAEAETSYRRTIAADADYVSAHINLGVVLKEQGRYAEAEASYRAALRLEPDDAETLNNMSVVLKEQGRNSEAESSCRRALELSPGNALAHNNLGIILKQQGRLAEAADSYRMALELAPDYPEAHNNLGVALRALGFLAEAEQEHRKAIALRPTYANASNNLGTTLTQLGRHAEAETLYRTLLQLEANNAQTHNNLGGTLAVQGRADEAMACFRQALLIDPDFSAAHSNLLFAMNYSTGVTATSRLEEARHYGRTVAKRAKFRFSAWPCPMPAHRLRLGLVSADLRSHPVAFFLESLLAHIDKDRFELIAYQTGRTEDEMTLRMRQHFAAWRPIAELNDEAAAKLIHSDEIHILIDLSGHTTDNRLPVFAWKPAPLQASWLGYFATTGVAEIDYLLADATGIPLSAQNQYLEEIWYLPETRLCFAPPREIAPVVPAPALRTGHLTFACFQNLSKIGDEVLATWAAILSAVPTARLRCQSPQLNTAQSQHAFSQRLAQQRINPARISLIGGMERQDYLRAHGDVDVILDTFPYPGGTTTCEALWMGVPTLTLAGDSMIARQGASLLSAAEMSDWIVDSRDAYIERAVSCCRDLASLNATRMALRQKVLNSPLFDQRLFARRFEDAMEGMWKKFSESMASSKCDRNET